MAAWVKHARVVRRHQVLRVDDVGRHPEPELQGLLQARDQLRDTFEAEIASSGETWERVEGTARGEDEGHDDESCEPALKSTVLD